MVVFLLNLRTAGFCFLFSDKNDVEMEELERAALGESALASLPVVIDFFQVLCL